MKRKKDGTVISDGKIGERLAEQWFKNNGWKMDRHQPPTKVVRIRGKLFTVPMASNGISDYTGYKIAKCLDNIKLQHVACEVKEAYGDSMPASRLKEKQRDYLNELRPFNSAFVGVCWMDGINPYNGNKEPYIEMFSFVYSGSYKKGTGIQ